MARSRIALLPVLALLAAAPWAPNASALIPPQRGPLFTAAPQGPFAVGEAPTDVMSGNFDPTGRGFEKNLLIGYAQGSRAKLFYASRRPLGLRKLGWFGAPTGPAVLGGNPGYLAILSPASSKARLFEIETFGGKLISESTVRVGPEPVAAVVDDFVHAHPEDGWDYPELAVPDRRTGQLQLFTRDGGKPLHPAGTVPLGPEPTAAVGHECCVPLIYVTTAGDNRLTLLSDFEDGEFEQRRSFPVGSRPSAVALGDFVEGDYGDEEVAAANRGSDDVTILDAVGRTYEFRTIGTYSVGHEPVAIAALDIDHRGGDDLAVVNRGSNDVSILLDGRKGHFHSGGTYPVGRRPVALAAFNFNRSFGPDLAVVNRGSNNLTVLTRRVDGDCRGQEAQRVVGTRDPDRLFGLGEGPNETKGFGGGDMIQGGFGVDCLSGEGGDDTIYGGSQGDLINGGRGDDHLDGEHGSSGIQGPGDDTLIGGAGEDQIVAGKGADRVLAADGERDRIDCGKGDDLAVVDRIDKTRNCERVRVSSAGSRPAPRAARPARWPRGRG